MLVFMCYHINISNESTTSEAHYLNFSIIVVSREPLINQSIRPPVSGLGAMAERKPQLVVCKWELISDLAFQRLYLD